MAVYYINIDLLKWLALLTYINRVPTGLKIWKLVGNVIMGFLGLDMFENLPCRLANCLS